MKPLARIIEKAKARREKWNHKVVYDLPQMSELEETCIIGSFSIILMESKQRLLKKSSCVTVAPGLKETPSTIARDYLLFKYGRGPKVQHSQIQIIVSGLRPMPLMAIPCDFDRGWYIDIQACFWSMMLRAGWDCDYWPGRWLFRGTPPADFPFPENKITRNCLVSAGLTSDMVMWTRAHGLQTVEHGNPLANLQLYRLISDTLNSIAAECRNAGAVYANTDGYICRDFESMCKCVKIISQWGLPARIKAEGSGRVTGPGDYKVGPLQSKRGLLSQTPIHNIYEVPFANWLKGKISWLAGLV